VYDREGGTTTRIQGPVEPSNESYDANVSGDGRFYTFVSTATNLVSDDTNNRMDIFMYRAW
jgi:hypothetical protein